MRAKDKANTSLADMLRQENDFFISTVVEYEVELGMTANHRVLWSSILEELTIVPFTSSMAVAACEIKHDLKARGTQIALADLFIAATAIANGLPLATLNRKHFDKIDGLKLILPQQETF
jgi:predicted nucleic acid-binding protein